MTESMSTSEFVIPRRRAARAEGAPVRSSLPALGSQDAALARQASLVERQTDQLLRTVTHDLGANLLVMEGACRKLLKCLAAGDSVLPPDAAEAVRHLDACVRQSRSFVADLGDLAKGGDLTMTAERLDLDAVVEGVLFEQRDLIAERRVQVSVRGPLGVAWLNATRGRQVFTNLVRNALRHGCDASSPRLDIAPVSPGPGTTPPIEPAQRRIWLRIWDNGPGVPAAYRERIFLPGERAPNAAADGSGLGLAIVRRIVEHYRGTIALDPAAPGASFVFSLPAAE